MAPDAVFSGCALEMRVTGWQVIVDVLDLVWIIGGPEGDGDASSDQGG